MRRYALGVDIGTTAVKALLISDGGEIIDEARADHDLESPRPNWAEEDAEVWWSNAKKTIADVLSKDASRNSRICAIGVSGMVPAIVMLDRFGRPVRKTIQQNDGRAVDQIDRILKLLDQNSLFEATGTTTNQQHVAPRLLWVKDNEPEAYASTECVMGSYDYVSYKLTGVKSIEVNWAIESGLYDIRKRSWIAPLFPALGLDPSWFPDVNQSIDIIGYVTGEAAEETGLPVGIPVIAGSADHVASTLAAGIVKSGDLLIKFGGAGDILYCVDEIKTSRELYFDDHIVPGCYLLNGCMASSGSLVKWFVGDILGQNAGGDVFKKLDEAALGIPPASDGLVILPYFLGEKTPIFDAKARGVMFGLTLSHTSAHIFRAILESVIYGFKHHIEVIERLGFKCKHILATNGGAKSAFWCQIASDVLGTEIVSFAHHPGSALGVAYLAGMSVGMFDDWERIKDFLDGGGIYKPDPRRSKIYAKSYRVYRNLYCQLKPSFDDIQGLYSMDADSD